MMLILFADEDCADGSLTIVRRTSTRRSESQSQSDDVTTLSTETLPPIDTPEACEKAAQRLAEIAQQVNRK